jgi:hypothetical protein
MVNRVLLALMGAMGDGCTGSAGNDGPFDGTARGAGNPGTMAPGATAPGASGTSGGAPGVPGTNMLLVCMKVGVAARVKGPVSA